MGTHRPAERPHAFRIRLTAADEQQLRERARTTGEDVHALRHEALRSPGEQLGLHTDDGLHVTLVGDELRITLTPLGERRLAAARIRARVPGDEHTPATPRSRDGQDQDPGDSAGPPFHVVSAEQAEPADLVACVTDETPSYFADDVHTVCADCGVPIRHRPHVPRRPRKVCLDCARKAALN
jgi:hypothetical protein